MSIFNYAAFALFPLTMAYAAASDLLSMTIPNRVSIILVAGFAALAPFVPGMDLATFGLHLAAGAAVLAGGFILFSFGWVGGGDAKIAAAVALWLGFGNTAEFLIWTALFGGALTLVLLLARRRLLPVFAIRHQWIVRLHDPDTGVPYGLALGAAALMIYPQTGWSNLVFG